MQGATRDSSPAMQPRPRPSAWASRGPSDAEVQRTTLAVALAAVLVVYAPVLAGMAVEWATIPSLSHGVAVPLISAFLIWHRRHLVAAESVGSSRIGLALLAAALAILVTGSVSGETFLSRASIPLACLGVVLFLAGPGVTRQVWPAIAYLVFMIPLPYLTVKAVTARSRLFEAGMTATMLRWLEVPVLQQGVMLHLPRLTLEVAEECTSVRIVAPLVALGAAYAQIGARPVWIRVALILSAAPLGLTSNIVRLVLTGLGAYHLGPVALDSVVHQFSGTTVFLGAVMLLVALDCFLLRLERSLRR